MPLKKQKNKKRQQLQKKEAVEDIKGEEPKEESGDANLLNFFIGDDVMEEFEEELEETAKEEEQQKNESDTKEVEDNKKIEESGEKEKMEDFDAQEKAKLDRIAKVEEIRRKMNQKSGNSPTDPDAAKAVRAAIERSNSISAIRTKMNQKVTKEITLELYFGGLPLSDKTAYERFLVTVLMPELPSAELDSDVTSWQKRNSILVSSGSPPQLYKVKCTEDKREEMYEKIDKVRAEFKARFGHRLTAISFALG